MIIHVLRPEALAMPFCGLAIDADTSSLHFYTSTITTEQRERTLDSIAAIPLPGRAMLVVMRRRADSELSANELSPSLSREGLRALDRGADGAVNDELGKHTKCSADTEEDGVEVLLGEAVVLEEDT